jgi:lambda repressor-like predicted transcriptional regulator
MQARSLLRATTEEVSMPARIHLRTAQFRKFCALKSWTTDDAKARAMGIDPATLSRVLKGRCAPGERFIAASLAALPEVEFADLYEVIVTEDDEAA